MEQITRLLFDPDIILGTLPALLAEGLLNTLYLSFSGFGLGFLVGLVLALMGISRRWWVRLPAKVWIDLFRGLPAILVIIYVYFGFTLSGARIFEQRSSYAILALTLIASAYIAEILRAGIQSIDKGQMEAARSVGMGYLQAMWLVIIPQGIRRVLPPLTNELIALIKDSSLVFVIGMSVGDRELFRIGQQVVQEQGNLSALTAAGLMYVAITVPLTRVINWMDTRLREGKPIAADEDVPQAAKRPLGGR